MLNAMKRTALVILAACMLSCTGKEGKQIEKYSISQLYKNISIAGGRFFADDKKILFSSNETGIYNVFEIDIARRSTKQITNSATESCFAIDYADGTGQILYSSDKGGNENDHIFLLREDGSVTDLTPGDNVKAAFTGWNKDRTTMYFMSNRRDPRFFDLYKMNPGQWKEEMVYRNTEGFEYAGITRDGSIIALSRSVSTSESKLYLYDIAARKMTEVSEPDKPGLYSGTGFSSDKRFFYYTTNAEREFAYLASYETATGQRRTIYETDWDVEGGWLSKNDRYRIILINDDARNVIKMFDLNKGEEVAYPEIPGTDIVNFKISDSEKYLLLTLGSSKTTGDLYLWEIGSDKPERLTSTMNPEINPGNLADAEVIRYRSFDGLEIPSIFYKPLTATVKNKVPALVMVHGGPGGQSRVGYNPLVQYLVNHGYAILAVNNRGSSGYGKSFFRMDDRNHGDKDLRDCIWGKKWLQSLDYIDSARIGIIGGSYGGFMTMAAMTFHPEEFMVGVNFFGVTNWLRTLKSIPPYWASFREALYNEMGDPYTADSIRLYDISPLFHAGNIRNPVMVLQGANDPRVLKVESDEIVAAAKANNVPVEYIVFADEGHGFIRKENEIRGDSLILVFLDRFLKNAAVF